MLRLCPPCAAASSRWLDYRLPAPPIQLCVIGGRVRDIQERQEARFREWRDTIRYQQALIAQQCAEGFHEQDITSNA